MRKNLIIFHLPFIALCLLLLFGCTKEPAEKQADPLSITGKKNSSRTLTVPDVYVAGNENNQAQYWKNGTGVILTGGLQATGIVVDGTDVHVCGYGLHPTTSKWAARYWKNGVLTTLSDGTDYVFASGIAVSGTDVYVSGRVGLFGNTAVYWKNGVQVSLGSGVANGIFVAPNGDVYVPNGDWGNPSYWKNGTLVTLTGPTGAYVRAIAVNGTDVHVVGSYSSGPSETALYWKNGTLQSIMTPNNTNAIAVAVNSNGQAVFSGNTGSDLNNLHIAYWDGIQDLHILASGKYVATSTGIAVDLTTDDIYVCGSEFNSSTPPAIAKYWKVSSTGGITPVTLSGGTTDATALAIALGW